MRDPYQACPECGNVPITEKYRDSQQWARGFFAGMLVCFLLFAVVILIVGNH